MKMNGRHPHFLRLPSGLQFRHLARRWPATLTSTALCTLSLFATLLITLLLFKNIQHEKVERFDRLNRQTISAIHTRMLAYENALENARALFIANPNTSMREYHAFVTAMDLATQYPGLQAMAFASRVKASQLPSFLASESQRVSKDYAVWPPGARDEYWPIVFTEPLDWRNRRTVGFDLKTNPEREAAMQASIDTAETTLTRKITLIQETKVDRQPGFLMVVPVFRASVEPSTVAERREQVVGFICGAFRAYDLFSQITQELNLNHFINIRVYDGSRTDDPQALLFQSRSEPQGKNDAGEERGSLVATTKIQVAGETWTVAVDSLKSFDQEISQKPVWLVFLGGLLVTILLYRLGRASTSFNRSLMENENQLRLVTDSLPVLVARFDAKGNYQFANASHTDWFGIAPSLIKGQPYQNFIGNAAKERDASFFARALCGERVSFESVIQHRSKGLRQVKIDCVPERSQIPGPQGFIAHALDVTEQATLVKALKRGENLYRDIARENERLYRESRSLNRAKDEFLTTLSHELRTPLTVILGHAELLKKSPHVENGELNDSVADSVDSISRNASVQMQIISDLIDVSSIVTGKIALQMQTVAIDEILRTTIEKLRPVAAEKRLRLTEDIRGSRTLIMGDGTRLQQIISNLLTNSIKFTPSGGIVAIRACSNEKHFEIEITDTGQGIDRDFLPYVFDRFRQEDNSVTRKFGGLGIGLSIVRNLVEAHGGQVSATSEGQGKGSSFVVRFPLLEAATSVSIDPAKNAAGRSAKPITYDLNNARVLVVDDEPDTRKLIARYLERSGALVEMASSAQAAMDAYKEQQPELLVSDIGMPVEDGYTLIRRIRAYERQFALAPVPAVALTAFARAEDRMRALDSGFQVHLTKPVTSDRLAEVCSSLVATLPRQKPVSPDSLVSGLVSGQISGQISEQISERISGDSPAANL